jgi:ubiquinone/menaquinone biosynthesis C-methylase UbiE
LGCGTGGYSLIQSPPLPFPSVFSFDLLGGGGTLNLSLTQRPHTGQATTALSRFDHIIGIDPSESMIEKARAAATAPAAARGPSSPQITFLKHSAEDLDFLEDRSVDLVVSGTSH